MAEIPPHDPSEITSSGHAKKLDWNTAADAFEKMGDHEQAKKFRLKAEKEAQASAEPVVTDVAAEMRAIAEKTISSIPPSERNKPPSFHEPELDTRKVGPNTMAAVQDILKRANQNQQPSSPNAPKGPPTTPGTPGQLGGK
jgi:hypothetical protein